MERDESKEASSHEVFHYRKPFTKPGTELSNERLVSAIESFSHTDIATHSFEARTVQKIFLILALRVWIEKQIYEAHPELLTQPGVGKQLGSLIKVAFDKGWKGPEDVTQEFLNAKKTMLNHNAHVKAQASPFDFAINLSIEDVRAEIEDVKKHFGAEPHPI